tara:strand:+ start:211 stop:702 length:492 start_codon:yes stop_codon:yes gene_type:complete
MATAGALGSLGSDLAFSVSFGIANELLDAAKEAHLSEDELIAIVLALSVLLAAVPSTFVAMRNEWRKYRGGNKASESSGKDGKGGSEGSEGSGAPVQPSGLLEFASLLLRMAQRISLSICVQLVASNVRLRQPLRSVRVVSLLAVSIFFLFLESTSSVGNVHR